ncbi:glycosyl hydrolase catalytic core-domain-containing protein [Xylariales sp. AK1849]|nr:glycosyl hydrolase catalytic core-domain-containing protein [Xylariales sp. AK1849]
MRQNRYSFTPLVLVVALYASQINATISSKRGLAYSGDSHDADYNLLLSAESPISWYYTWSLNQAQDVNDTVTFIPLIHNTDDASNSNLGSILNALPSSSTHLLSFNEPDGTTGSGGSSIEPEDAARSYLDSIAPFRDSETRSWNISHPSITGSTQGLDWLRSFNESCYDLDPAGCPTDFVAVHWYGDFSGLASWLGTLHEFYTANSTGQEDLKFWVTEMALPQQDDDATVSMMNQSLAYLDGLDYVEAYAWFGAFRSGDDANGFTGDAVSLFDDDGGLTELGSLYLGGEENGFAKGTKGEGDSAASTTSMSTWAVVVAGLAVVSALW